MTEVVAALIWQQGRFLACQRPAHKARGLLWEFVGGKVEPGETRQQALVRECKEELSITVHPGDIAREVIHRYPDLTVHLTLFYASIVEGEPRRLEHNAIRWLTVDEVDDYDFCPADREIIAMLKRLHGPDDPLQQQLFALQDAEYRAFHSRLMPTVDPARVIGVRTPVLRAFARQFAKTPQAEEFLHTLPHKYYEENNLHGMLLSAQTDPGAAIAALDEFLPYVNNWATCDQIAPAAFRRCPPQLLPAIRRWLAGDHPYTVRFGMGMLLRFYLEDSFQPEYLQWVAAVQSEEYYVKMMQAWYFAEALAKQPAAALPYLQQNRLPRWVHNKAIQKAIESRRISPAQKAQLRSLKRK